MPPHNELVWIGGKVRFQCAVFATEHIQNRCGGVAHTQRRRVVPKTIITLRMWPMESWAISIRPKKDYQRLEWHARLARG